MPLPREIALEDISPCKGRLLVAEDNAALRDYLVAILKAEGYDVAEASNADDLADTLAVSLRPDLGSGEFDLVIAEDRLVVRGETTLGNGRWSSGKIPPFVLIGAVPGRAPARGGLGKHAVAMFDKPLDIESLRDAVRCLSQTVFESRQAQETIDKN
jgi:two-component system response regulator (stage 0 sporulation protein F)